MSSFVSLHPDNSSAPAAEPPTRGLRPYTHVFAVFVCGMFAFLDLYCTQPLLPLLSHVFGATEAQVSLTISASTLGVAVSAILLAIFAERTSRKRTIVGSMFVLAITALLTATAHGLPELALWRLLQGLVTPGIFILTIAYITEEWPARLVPRVMSVYVAGTVFGGFCGRLIGGALAERFGWRVVFLVLGIAGLAGAALAARLLSPARSRAHRSHSLSRITPLLVNLRNRRLLATFGIGFCALFTLVAVFSYITFYLAAPPFYLSAAALSWLFAVYLAGLAVVLAAGSVIARIGLRVGMIASAAICFTGVALTLLPWLTFVAIGLALASSGIFISQICANSFLRDAAPEGSRVSAAGMYICSYYIGGTAGGVVPGIFWRHGGWPSCVALTLALLLIAGLLAFFGWRSDPSEPVPI